MSLLQGGSRKIRSWRACSWSARANAAGKKATTFDVNDTSGKITENRMIAVGLMADTCALLTHGVDEGCVELSC